MQIDGRGSLPPKRTFGRDKDMIFFFNTLRIIGMIHNIFREITNCPRSPAKKVIISFSE